MSYQAAPATPRLHPLLLGAAASVMLVSLLGAAAITGVLPSSHGSVAPSAASFPEATPALAKSALVSSLSVTAPMRYLTADGQVLEAVPNTQLVAPVHRASAAHVNQPYRPAPVTRHRVSQHYAQNTYSRPAHAYELPYSTQQQQRPMQSYVSDMNPVGTGLGAVVGGMLGNQVGGGNGKKIATVAGVLLGGYAGNEVAHNRSPLPW